MGDLTGDGKADLAVAPRADRHALPVDDERRDGRRRRRTSATVDPAYDIVGTGDYNGDGKSDILWRHLTNGELWVWLMNGATTLSATYVDTVDPAYAVQGSGDLNGDGKADIVWRHETGGRRVGVADERGDADG